MEVKYCPHQHEVLVTYIRYVLQCWGPLDELPLSYWINETVTPWKRSSWIRVTPELERVLTRARILSKDCSMELPLLNAVLRHADRSQAFMDIVREIQWYTSVVYNGNICKDAKSEHAQELKDFPWQAKIGVQDMFLLEKAEQEDWHQLMLEVGKYYARHHDCSVEECGNIHGQMDLQYCLKAQVLQRLQSRDDLNINKVDYKSLLWSFDPEVVKHDRPLGSGAFGLVSQVTWLGSKYAQKIYNFAGLHSLPAEVEALAKLNHLHIVKVYACSEDSLLMDLMCTDLLKFMKSRIKGGARNEPFSLAAAMDLMLQIGDAVNYLHSENLAHRDLKSSNILVNPMHASGLVGDDDGFVFAKIADFGMAKVKRDITHYSHLTHNVGTRRWMAPEVFGANMEDDHLEHAFPMKADVYSFGIICFEILTGQEPFSDVPLSTLYSKLTAPIPLRPRLPSSCPPNLASLIYECWDADPRKRPTFEDVCRVLRYLNGLPTLIALNVPRDGECPFGRLTPLINNKNFDTKKEQGMFNILQYRMALSTFRCGADYMVIAGVQIFLNGGKLAGFKIFYSKGRSAGRDFGTREDQASVELESSDSIGSCFETGTSSSCRSKLIYFDPCEFLVQVEGLRSGGRVVSLSFITTREKYGPYGTFNGLVESFCSDCGIVVGFTGYTYISGFGIASLKVHTIPNIARCLLQYLGNKESSA